MCRYLVLIIAAAFSLALAADALAAAKKKPRHARHAHPAHVYAPAPRMAAPRFDPPRMYEVRPGVWISTWDCVTDEGYGRVRPCSAGSDKAQ